MSVHVDSMFLVKLLLCWLSIHGFIVHVYTCISIQNLLFDQLEKTSRTNTIHKKYTTGASHTQVHSNALESQSEYIFGIQISSRNLKVN